MFSSLFFLFYSTLDVCFFLESVSGVFQVFCLFEICFVKDYISGWVCDRVTVQSSLAEVASHFLGPFL